MVRPFGFVKGVCRISSGKFFKGFKKTCIPRVLCGYMARLRRTCGPVVRDRRFGGRFCTLLGSCINHPSPLCCTGEVDRGCKYRLCLGHRSLGRANTRGVGGAVNRVLVTGGVNGAHVVTRANTKRRNITATAIYTLVSVGYRVFVNTASIRHRRAGIRHVGVLNTGIGPIHANGVALDSTYSRTVHS